MICNVIMFVDTDDLRRCMICNVIMFLDTDDLRCNMIIMSLCF